MKKMIHVAQRRSSADLPPTTGAPPPTSYSPSHHNHEGLVVRTSSWEVAAAMALYRRHRNYRSEGSRGEEHDLRAKEAEKKVKIHAIRSVILLMAIVVGCKRYIYRYVAELLISINSEKYEKPIISANHRKDQYTASMNHIYPLELVFPHLQEMMIIIMTERRITLRNSTISRMQIIVLPHHRLSPIPHPTHMRWLYPLTRRHPQVQDYMRPYGVY